MIQRCLICEQRPRQNGSRYCQNCASRIMKDKAERASRKPSMYLTYAGNVVGLYRKDNGNFYGELLKRDAAKLPKSKTLDLNTRNERTLEYTRHQVKFFKRKVLQISGF